MDSETPRDSQDTATPLDWTSGGEMPLEERESLRRQRREQRKLLERKERRERRARLFRFMLRFVPIVLIVLGAAMGAVIDFELFGAGPAEWKERLLGCLLLAPLVGGGVYYRTMEHHAIMVALGGDAFSGRTPRNGSGYSALSADSANWGIAATGILATLFAGGMNEGTVVGYACVIAGEVLLVVPYYLVMRHRRMSAEVEQLRVDSQEPDY